MCPKVVRVRKSCAIFLGSTHQVILVEMAMKVVMAVVEQVKVAATTMGLWIAGVKGLCLKLGISDECLRCMLQVPVKG